MDPFWTNGSTVGSPLSLRIPTDRPTIASMRKEKDDDTCHVMSQNAQAEDKKFLSKASFRRLRAEKGELLYRKRLDNVSRGFLLTG